MPAAAGRDGEVADVGLDQVVEEVGAERDVRDQPVVHGGDLSEHGDAADLGERHRHAEGGHRGAPAARAEQQDRAGAGGLQGGGHAPDRARHRVAVGHRQARVDRRRHEHQPVDRAGHAAAEDRAVGSDEQVGGGHLGGELDPAALALDADLERAALDDVDLEAVAGQEVGGELDVDRVVVGAGQRFQQLAHGRHEAGVGEQALEVGRRRRPRLAREQGAAGLGQQRRERGVVAAGELVGGEVEDVDAALGVAPLAVGAGFRAHPRGVEGDQPGVVVVGALDGAGAEAEDQAQDAGPGVDVAVPDEGVEREPDAGELGEEQAAVHLTGHALDEQRHLLVAVHQPAVEAVVDAVRAEGAGVDGADGGDEGVEALAGRALVGAEDAFVLAGERVAVGVLQQAAGAHDDRPLAEVVEHLAELVEDVVGEAALEHPGPGLGGAVQAVLEGAGGGQPAQPVARPPAVVDDQVGVEHVGADEERVVFLQQAGPAGVGAAEGGAGQQHAERLAADQAGADHPAHDADEVGEVEELGGQFGQAFLAGGDDLEQAGCPGGGGGVGGGVGGGLFERLPGLLEHLGPDAGAADRERAPRLAGAEADGGEGGAAGDRGERVADPLVDHVEGGRVALEHLERLQERAAVVAEHLEHDLGGAGDRVERVRRVAVLEQGEAGQRADLVDVGADDLIEVGEHPVAEPVGGEVGEAVEDEAGGAGAAVDHVEDAGDEALEARGGVDVVDGGGARRQQCGVAGEAEVDGCRPVARGGGGERGGARLVGVDAVDQPHHVVAGQQAVEEVVECGRSGARGGRGAGGHAVGRVGGGQCGMGVRQGKQDRVGGGPSWGWTSGGDRGMSCAPRGGTTRPMARRRWPRWAGYRNERRPRGEPAPRKHTTQKVWERYRKCWSRCASATRVSPSSCRRSRRCSRRSSR